MLTRKDIPEGAARGPNTQLATAVCWAHPRKRMLIARRSLKGSPPAHILDINLVQAKTLVAAPSRFLIQSEA